MTNSNGNANAIEHANANAVMSLRNVSKKIGSKTLIDNLSFDVPRGEVFGFLGPNGAGKTTTIRMIVGLISMSGGEIYVEGISVRKNFEQAMQHVGAIVENPEMYKFLTGYQNLLHYSRMHDNVSKERIDEVIGLVGLNNRIHDKVKTYSLGMRQRLGVAQALLHRPKVLILDEPTNGLDPAGIRELRDYLRTLAKEEGISVIVSSHLLSEMELMCDRVAVIQNGKLIDVRMIHEMNEEGALVKVSLEVDQVDAAVQALEAAFGREAVQTSNNQLDIAVEREQIPEAIVALVQAQVKIYSVRQSSKSLEDRFLEMTGGGEIV